MKVLQERQKTHGDFHENARIAQGIKELLHSGANWDKCSVVKKEALEMIAHKMARAVSGDPTFEDHYVDMSGYATLAKNEKTPRIS